MALTLSLLGGFDVARDGRLVTHFRSEKVRALLAFLAVEAGRPHPRTSLAGLLWPDQPDAAARRNLSQTLVRLRQALAGDPVGPDGPHDRAPPDLPGAADIPFLRLTGQTVQWDAAAGADLDVARFGRRIRSDAAADLEAAAALYRGEFLAGFGLPECQAFDEWLLLSGRSCCTWPWRASTPWWERTWRPGTGGRPSATPGA